LVLFFAISVCIVSIIASIIDFGYNAYHRTDSFTAYPDPLSGQRRSDSSSEYVGFIEMDLDLHMQLDAAVALLASAAVLGISVGLSKLSRQRKRLVFGAEAVGLYLTVVSIGVRILRFG
jgi:hypothetical protein